MQNSWFSSKAKEIQHYAYSKNMLQFYSALKAIYGPQSSGTSTLLSADGKHTITDREEILKRWAEYFENVLNCPSNINNE